MNELEKSPDIILFIDEIHTIIGAGGASGSLDASTCSNQHWLEVKFNVLELLLLMSTDNYIEKDGALERRFQKVIVEPTTIEETVQILNTSKDKYEDHHNVNYTPDALEACVSLTSRYITDRHLPDKADRCIDEVGSRVHITNINVPKEIIDVEKKIEDIKEEKNRVVRSQQYEEAARLRDSERKLNEELEAAKKEVGRRKQVA